MKKYLLIISVVFCIVCFLSCSKNYEEDNFIVSRPDIKIEENLSDTEMQLIEKIFSLSITDDCVFQNVVINNFEEIVEVVRSGQDLPFEVEAHISSHFPVRRMQFELVIPEKDFNVVMRDYLHNDDVHRNAFRVDEEGYDPLFNKQTFPKEDIVEYKMWFNAIERDFRLKTGGIFHLESSRLVVVIISKQTDGKITIYGESYFNDWDLDHLKL